MITAQELRLGNVVGVNGSLATVVSINYNHYDLDYEIEVAIKVGIDAGEIISFSIDEIKAVDISDVWLLNYGFKKDEYKNTFDDYTLNGYRILKESDTYSFLVYGSSIVLSKFRQKRP